jgi:hypothetical protein
LLILPAEGLAEDAACHHEEGCAQRVSRYDDIFDDDEMSLSLLQMKAKQIQANSHRAELETQSAMEGALLAELEAKQAELESKEVQAPSWAKGLEAAAKAKERKENSKTVDEVLEEEEEKVTVSTMQMPPISLDFASLSKIDSQSRSYLLHSISTRIKEAGQIGVLIATSGFVLMIFLASQATAACKKKDQVLQVQVRVDHFVTHSLTSKKIIEAPMKAPPQVIQTPRKLPADEEPASEPACQEELHEQHCQELVQERCQGLKPSQNSNAVCPVELRKGTPALIDPVFLLPLCETWYAVCVEPMGICDGSFDILRIAGYPRLHGTVQHVDGMRVLEITCSSLPAKQGQVLASVAVEDSPSPEAVLKVAAGGKQYGTIRPFHERGYALACDQEDVLTMSTEDGRHLVLRCAEDEKVWGSASWFEQSDFFSGAGHLAIRVNPNVDTILVLSCALALTILGGSKDLIRCRRSADSGAG